MTPLKIVGLGGSLAKVSTSRSALRVALEGAASAGAETTLLDLRELDLPMYDPDSEQTPAAAAQLIEACYGAVKARQAAGGPGFDPGRKPPDRVE